MEHLEIIRDMATTMRDVLETLLTESIGRRETTGACLHAAIILSSALDRFAGTSTRICGGGPPMDGGLLDRAGARRGHYWVEGATDSGEAFIADISADQFGYETVVVLPLVKGRELYLPGNAELIAQHVEDELNACSSAS